MLYAKQSELDRNRILAQPRQRAVCPGCEAVVIAKCGDINAWHWAHESLVDCDPWSECESQWHLDWKRSVPRSQCERVIGPHRADIVTARDWIVELQHSSLTFEEVRERERFYGNMVWIIDASTFEDRFTLRRLNKNSYVFKWRHVRKWILAIEKPIFFDFGTDRWFNIEGGKWSSDVSSLFRVKKIHPNVLTRDLYGPDKTIIDPKTGAERKVRTYLGQVKGHPAAGWGRFVSRGHFLARITGRRLETRQYQCRQP
jgi:hypothetical protein